MRALHSRTEISLILQKLTEKLTSQLSLAATRTFRPNGVARYIRLELFPSVRLLIAEYPFRSSACSSG